MTVVLSEQGARRFRAARLSGLGLILSATLVACGGDLTSSTGELGRLNYSLYTTYEVPQGSLTEARIITGHPQTLGVGLTTQGRREVDEPSQIVHRLSPSAGVVIHNATESPLPDPTDPTVQSARFTVSQPGEYTLESLIEDELVDKLQLQFDTPGGFELSMKVREPWGESFDVAVGDPLAVEQGSQLIVLAIPVDDQGLRLAGVMTPEITVDPQWAVTPGVNVYTNTEDATWKADGESDYYFIEPTTVTFTITDPVSDASSTQEFTVTPVDKS